MHLSEKAITKFQQMFYELYGTEISREEALLYGSQLTELVRLIYKPIKVSELKQKN